MNGQEYKATGIFPQVLSIPLDYRELCLCAPTLLSQPR